MIANDFEYYKPSTISEATKLFSQLDKEGKKPLYFNGGTEIITFMRIHTLYTETKAIIDIKEIPECSEFGFVGDRLIIGASISLATIEDHPYFPLLSKTCNRIADHTSREKITLAGNICSALKYKEAILPLLLTNSEIVIAGTRGTRTLPIRQLYDNKVGKILLQHGELIVQVKVDKRFEHAAFISKKMTQNGRIGYPLLTIAAIRDNERIRFACSGLCDAPFYIEEIDETIQDKTILFTARMEKVLTLLPSAVLDDMNGSAGFRTFIFQQILEEAYDAFREGAK